MAKKIKVENPQGIRSVEETLTKTEQYLEENYKTLLTILAVLVIMVGVFWLGRMYINKRNDEAQSQMFQAEKWMEIDSLDLALNGDGNYLGFIDIAKEYKMTNSGNLARYCTGICYLHKGQFEDAIEYLDSYKIKDKIIGSLATGAIGDALVELGDLDKGVEKYIEAANLGDNSFNTPIFLMKAGEILEMQQKYAEARELYEKIKDEYPESNEGTSIDKYIARINMLMK